MKLLSRDNFREGVFRRDKHQCVVCGAAAKDAHHILERRLWSDGGYYLENGVSVCESCHLRCESTEISVEEIRAHAGILKKIIPPHFYDDQEYDKWGNPLLQNGQRLIGELFFDESVQKVIAPYLSLFTRQVKYPRTYHLPWSPGMNDDDKMMASTSIYTGRMVVALEKFDGENTSLYSDYIHARSLDGRNHPSRNWVKNFWSGIKHEIPEGWRICGENVYARHAIPYDDLESFFYGFSIWDDKNTCLSWADTVDWFNLLGIVYPRVLFNGIYDEHALKQIDLPYDKHEGYVLRVADSFSFSEFKSVVGKFVRKDHIRTTKHWANTLMVPNSLRS